ncbi:MAG: ATP phosphoribosyltransferase regulatory subunit [Christensenellales bacterium]
MSLPNGFVNRGYKHIKRRNEFVKKAAAVLESIGYREGYPALLYPMRDSFPREGADDRIKLIDCDGTVLCVSDDTVTALLQTCSETARVYGCAEEFKLFGAIRNESCFSAILSGVAGIEGDAEIISAGVRIMEKIGLPKGKITLGNPAVIRGVAESCLNRQVSRKDLKRLIMGEAASEDEASATKFIGEIASAKGGVSIIGAVAEKITNKTSVDGLVGLFELSKLLEEYGVSDVEFDLSYIGDAGDSGILFSISDDVGNRIIDGGRRDFMNGKAVVRTVSLRIYPDYVISVRPELFPNGAEFDVVIGVADGIKPLKSAYRLKNGFADEGLRVTVLYKVNKEDTDSFASALGIESAVYVDENGNITY